jgi:hypothetical protein
MTLSSAALCNPVDEGDVVMLWQILVFGALELSDVVKMWQFLSGETQKLGNLPLWKDVSR